MPISKKVAFYTLGCKLNYSETSAISRLFEDNNYKIVDFTETPDIYVVNTCSVTENADKKCRKVVKEALKINAKAFVVIVGCYAQLKPKEISEIPGVDMVLGAAEKFNMLSHIDELTKLDKPVVKEGAIADVDTFIGAYSFGDRTRTFLKVQDGCDYSCAFCTIPLARGASRSDTVENIVESARNIAKDGVKEIVLSGVNIGDYGKNVEGNFLDLIKALDNVEDIKRFRISSIEPNLLDNEIIQFVANSRAFVPHFHIPLQSGNNEILALMRRRYKRELYVDRVEFIKNVMPDCCIGVDVIVGFPGETDEHFEDTYKFLSELDISYLHVFTYSERQNTLAAEMKDVVPNKVRAQRSKRLHILSDKKRLEFYRNQVSKNNIHNVLFESEEKSGQMHGFTDNYVKIKVKFDPLLTNQIKEVNLTGITEDGLVTISELAIPNSHLEAQKK
ncbi:MAG: threonylcarbamoyladenosine tRNA methylthiotransferase MtaB [Sphingobacteriales bacterium]|jgi:threonylcarbamoyladenosine tRNA methylthiotransferase MtaB